MAPYPFCCQQGGWIPVGRLCCVPWVFRCFPDSLWTLFSARDPHSFQTRFIVYKVYPRTPLRHFLQPIRIPAETGTGSVDKVLAFKPVDLSSALVSLARVSRESQGGWLLRNNTFMLTCSLCVRTHGHTHTTYMTCTPRVLAWKLEVMRVYQDSPRPQHEGPTFALSGT